MLGLVHGVKCTVPEEGTGCWPCAGGKLRRRAFPPSQSVTRSKLELVHSDVCGPMSEPSIGGHRYFIVFVDDFTRMTMVAFMKAKSETFEKLVDYIR